MPIRTIVTLTVAILLGLIAVLLVRSYLGSARPAQRETAVATTPVVVASQAIDRGKLIEARQLKVVKYPANAVPTGAFRNVNELTGAAADKRIALRSFAPNEPLIANRVSGPGGRLVLSASLAPGMRAVSFRTNEIAGVAGFVLPGDRVDILLTRTVGDNQTVTQVLAQNVLVLGIDQSDNDESNKPQVVNAVTVEANPKLAQMLTLAQSVGSVTLMLRQISDQAPLGQRAMTAAQFGFVRTAASASSGGSGATARPTGRPVRVIRGVETVEYRVP